LLAHRLRPERPLRDRAGHDNNYLALAGVMSHSGTREGGPVPQGVQIADIGAGSFGVIIGILSAVIHRDRTGEGQHIDVSMFDGSVLWNAYAAASYLVGGVPPDYESMPLNGGTFYGYYETSDGRYMSVGSLEPKFWEGFCKAIGREDLIPRRGLPGPDMERVKAEIRGEFAKRTFDEWRRIFDEYDVCVEPVLTLDEAFSQPHAEARGVVVDVPKSTGGTQRQVANPLKFSKAQPQYDHTGPEMGEHTDEILKEAGFSEVEVAALRDRGCFGKPA
jgi:alpha-methylacyl-CoA racemase